MVCQRAPSRGKERSIAKVVLRLPHALTWASHFGRPAEDQEQGIRSVAGRLALIALVNGNEWREVGRTGAALRNSDRI